MSPDDVMLSRRRAELRGREAVARWLSSFSRWRFTAAANGVWGAFALAAARSEAERLPPPSSPR